MSDLITGLGDLSDLAAVSGYEEEVARNLATRLADLADGLASDAAGGLVAWKVPSEGKPLVLLMAPVDGEGLVVKWIEPDGTLRFGLIGTVAGLLYQPVTIRGDSKVSGVVIPVDAAGKELVIEVGASTAEEVRSMGIRVGDPVVVERPLKRLGGDLLAARALRAQVCPALVIDAVARVSQRGSALGWAASFPAQTVIRPEAAQVALSALVPDPDLVIGVEAVSATDRGPIPPDSCPIRVGRGPGFAVVSPGMLANRRLGDLMVEVAEEEKIPHQLVAQKVQRYTCTAVQSLRGGLIVGAVLIPVRYLGGYEMASKRDISDAARLLQALFARLETLPTGYWGVGLP